jgi:hypothetical protein
MLLSHPARCKISCTTQALGGRRGLHSPTQLVRPPCPFAMPTGQQVWKLPHGFNMRDLRDACDHGCPTSLVVPPLPPTMTMLSSSDPLPEGAPLGAAPHTDCDASKQANDWPMQLTGAATATDLACWAKPRPVSTPQPGHGHGQGQGQGQVSVQAADGGVSCDDLPAGAPPSGAVPPPASWPRLIPAVRLAVAGHEDSVSASAAQVAVSGAQPAAAHSSRGQPVPQLGVTATAPSSPGPGGGSVGNGGAGSSLEEFARRLAALQKGRASRHATSPAQAQVACNPLVSGFAANAAGATRNEAAPARGSGSAQLHRAGGAGPLAEATLETEDDADSEHVVGGGQGWRDGTSAGAIALMRDSTGFLSRDEHDLTGGGQHGKAAAEMAAAAAAAAAREASEEQLMITLGEHGEISAKDPGAAADGLPGAPRVAAVSPRHSIAAQQQRSRMLMPPQALPLAAAGVAGPGAAPSASAPLVAGALWSYRVARANGRPGSEPPQMASGGRSHIAVHGGPPSWPSQGGADMVTPGALWGDAASSQPGVGGCGAPAIPSDALIVRGGKGGDDDSVSERKGDLRAGEQGRPPSPTVERVAMAASVLVGPLPGDDEYGGQPQMLPLPAPPAACLPVLAATNDDPASRSTPLASPPQPMGSRLDFSPSGSGLCPGIGEWAGGWLGRVRGEGELGCSHDIAIH